MQKTALEQVFKDALIDVDYCSLNYIGSQYEYLSTRQGVLGGNGFGKDAGALITVYQGGGYGYAATQLLTTSGIRKAIEDAKALAVASQKATVFNYNEISFPSHKATSEDFGRKPWKDISLKEKIDLLKEVDASMKVDDKIVDWSCYLQHSNVHNIFLNTTGASVEQRYVYLIPGMNVTANEGTEVIARSSGGAHARRLGWEYLDEIDFRNSGKRISEEALELLRAPTCPNDKMDLLLDSDQMYIQIHESIGHPLELDRILGDERNYAGTSFVTMDMFGSYQYGSQLLNVTFDPTDSTELASYDYDSTGVKAQKEYIIKDGLLVAPLGSQSSAKRAGIDTYVANARSCDWNRAPIDRMANLNVETGDKSLEEIIASVEKGIYMKSNNSWSIDDSRNKFQFGCEWAQLIEEGKLTKVVKKPNYRGISANFWRSLKAVGDVSTKGIYGTPYCGKGEPNQAVYVGHASPACLFENIDVFGA